MNLIYYFELLLINWTVYEIFDFQQYSYIKSEQTVSFLLAIL